MKTRIAFAAALLLAGAAQAHTQSWYGVMAPEAAGATGTGTVFIEYDEGGNTLLIQSSFSGLSGNTTVAHIHCCTSTAGVIPAGVAIQSPSLSGWPTGVKSGSYSRVFDLGSTSTWNATFFTASGGTTAGATTRLVAALDAGKAYFNVHSTTFTGGEIRSFVVSTVPEPTTWALMALGMAAVGAAARRRQA